MGIFNQTGRGADCLSAGRDNGTAGSKAVKPVKDPIPVKEAPKGGEYRRGYIDGFAAGKKAGMAERGSEGPSRGQACYERRLEGKTWRSMGANAYARAKAYAARMDLPWPLSSVVPLTEAQQSAQTSREGEQSQSR